MKEVNTLRLCMRYGGSCKLCPRNKKCDDEIDELLKILGDSNE